MAKIPSILLTGKEKRNGDNKKPELPNQKIEKKIAALFKPKQQNEQV